MGRVTMTIFGLDREAVQAHTESIRDDLDTKGSEYKGPIPYPTFTSEVALESIEEVPTGEWGEEPPSWLSGLTLDSEDYARLKSVNELEEDDGFTVFCRVIEIYNDGAIQDVMDIDLPETVCMHVKADRIHQHGGKKGRHGGRANEPYTYDPGQEHVTDTDYEAHNS